MHSYLYKYRIYNIEKTSSPPKLVVPKTPNPPNWRLNIRPPLPIIVHVIPETCLRVGDVARRLSVRVQIIVVASKHAVHATMIKKQETNIAVVVVVHF